MSKKDNRLRRRETCLQETFGKKKMDQGVAHPRSMFHWCQRAENSVKNSWYVHWSDGGTHRTGIAVPRMPKWVEFSYLS